MKNIEETDSKKIRIIKAATEIFSTRPYHQVKMEEIAESAGLGKGTLYCYFSGKEELFTQMIQESASIYFREALAAVNGKKTVREKLNSLFHYHLYFIKKYAAAARILVGERRLPRPGIEAAKERHRQMECFISELIQEGVESGEFRQVDISVVTQVILGTFSALWVSVLFGESSFDETEDTVDKILDFYLYGLTR